MSLERFGNLIDNKFLFKGGAQEAKEPQTLSSVASWCTVKQMINIIIIIILFCLVLMTMPILPFVYISYKAFHGKYGIVKLIRSFKNL